MSDETTLTTQDYVRAAIAGDAVKAQEIFNQLMSPKIVDAIDQQRTEVARNYFGQQPEVEIEVTNDAAEDEAASEDSEEVVAQDQEQEEESHENA